MFTSPSTQTSRARPLVLMAMAITIALIAVGAQAQTGVLQGTVTDTATGEPIEGAFVVAFGGYEGLPSGESGGGHGPRHAFTDADGNYVIDEIPVGDYMVKCGARGYLLAHGEASIAEGETTTLDFELEPRTFGAVEGTVNDAATGLPISGAHVMLLPSWLGGFEGSGDQDGGGGFWLHAVTGEDGTYRIENVPARDYNAKALSYGYFPSDFVPVTVVDGETAQADFELQPLAFGSLEGTVTDVSTGDPIEGAIVRVIPQAPGTEGLGDGWGGGWHRTMTDENGFYRFDEVVAGMVTVRVFAPGYFPGEGEVEIVTDATSVLDIALEQLAFGSLEGTVTDATTGEPIERVFVRA